MERGIDNYCYPQDERFLEQEIEIDAIAFAHFMTLKYLARTVISDNIKESILKNSTNH